MPRLVEAKPIKSAKRVFEVLEFFDAEHPEASVSDISRRYGYPQSSASELLTYLVRIGVLRRGRDGRTFRPTMRVAMLGAWVQRELVRDGRLLRLVDELSGETRASVVIATNSGPRVRCLHLVPRGGETMRQGDLLPLLHSAEGRALLLNARTELVRKYVHRLNAEAEHEGERIRFDDLAADLEAARARGYARLISEAGSAFAVLLPNADRGEPLALSVRTTGDADEAATVQSMRRLVSRTLGLVPLQAPSPRGGEAAARSGGDKRRPARSTSATASEDRR